MDLVKHEIDRINSQAAGKGSLSMVFKSGGITVGPLHPAHTLSFCHSANSANLLDCDLHGGTTT